MRFRSCFYDLSLVFQCFPIHYSLYCLFVFICLAFLYGSNGFPYRFQAYFAYVPFFFLFLAFKYFSMVAHDFPNVFFLAFLLHVSIGVPQHVQRDSYVFSINAFTCVSCGFPMFFLCVSYAILIIAICFLMPFLKFLVWCVLLIYLFSKLCFLRCFL